VFTGCIGGTVLDRAAIYGGGTWYLGLRKGIAPVIRLHIVVLLFFLA